MAKFDEFGKSLGEAAEMIAGKAVGFAKIAAQKTAELARIGKLNADILAQKEEIRKAYQEIGKIYYEYFQTEPHEPMKVACAKIDAAMAVIADRQAEIEVIKAQNPDEDFEEYVVVEEEENAEAAEATEAEATEAEDVPQTCDEKPGSEKAYECCCGENDAEPCEEQTEENAEE